ncbi:hypothetical protein [Nosocomiicoccus ampullae]|uniref:Uncharacterized protein n=1 Tax=Nosocomiicoccus ampullae TaxID=489910 RepID=A0A9Q2CXK5_9STAP|nr:hypothetical protein [Nosocomiicoccus ampullae]MBB5175267.1 hypothetical protein [Nosocomiicoccus ampullae]QYA46358.1 hypothetical protein KPF49_04980 [Nosocomiicoccus ampullae]
MRIFTEEEIEKWIDYTDEEVLPKEEFLGRCFACGEFLNTVELPEGPEKKIVCLRDRGYFIDQYEFLVKDGEI